MIKQFILAATSIAYILSIANIADAKKQAKIVKNFQQSDCQNSVDSSYEYNQLLQNDANFNKRMTTICQFIIKKYKRDNSFELDLEKKAESRGFGQTAGKEINSIKVNYSQRTKEIIDFYIEIKLTYRTYQRDGNKWQRPSESNQINRLWFSNKNGKFEMTRDSLYDSEGLKEI